MKTSQDVLSIDNIHLQISETILAPEKISILDKYQQTLFREIAYTQDVELEKIIETLHKTHKNGLIPEKRPRIKILFQVAHLLETHANSLSQLLTTETGKTITESFSEIERAADTFRIAGSLMNADSGGEVYETGVQNHARHTQAFSKRVPIGPSFFITPFNFPLNLAAHKVAPAIAIGNPFLLKPSPQAPLTTHVLAEILKLAGLSQDFFSLVHLTHNQTEKTVIDPRINYVSFTGSSLVGWKLKSLAPKKKFCLELGGNASCILEPDFDLEIATSKIVGGAFGLAGQSCISVQRIFIHQAIYEAAKMLLIQKARQIPLGDPMLSTTQMGPVISTEHAVKLKTFITDAIKKGGKLLCGGGAESNRMQPTLLENVHLDHELSCKELFGPIAILYPYQDIHSVIETINRSAYGIYAGIFTLSYEKAFQAFQKLDVKGVNVGNVPTWRSDIMPYGGVKESGYGEEGVRYAMQDMSETKTIAFHFHGTGIKIY